MLDTTNTLIKEKGSFFEKFFSHKGTLDSLNKEHDEAKLEVSKAESAQQTEVENTVKIGPLTEYVGASIDNVLNPEEKKRLETEAYDKAKAQRGINLEIIRDELYHESHVLCQAQNQFISHSRFGWYLDAMHADLAVQMEQADFCLKNCEQIELYKDDFAMGYALWHSHHFGISDCWFEKSAYSPLWFCHHGVLQDTTFCGARSVRESVDIVIKNCHIDGDEFAWNCSALNIENSVINSVRAFSNSRNIEIKNTRITSDNVLCYVDEVFIENTEITSSEALCHAENVTLKNCKLSGDSCGWNSCNITLIDCEIIGNRPFCFSRNVKMVNCKMSEAKNAFMGSIIDIEVAGPIGSINSPKSGKIKCESVGNYKHIAAEKEEQVELIVTDSQASEPSATAQL